MQRITAQSCALHCITIHLKFGCIKGSQRSDNAAAFFVMYAFFITAAKFNEHSPMLSLAPTCRRM
jgi:hypothetical protein